MVKMILLQNRNKGTDVENKCNGYQEGNREDELEEWNLTYTLLCIKQITNENLLYSAGNYWVFCGDLNGKEIQNSGCMLMYGWFTSL